MAGKTEFSTDFEKNKKRIDELLKVDQSFDLLYRVVMIGGKKACFYFIDGFCKDEIMEKILEFLYKITPEEMPENAHDFLKKKLPYGEIDLVRTENDFLQRMLSGVPMLIVEGYSECLAMDFRTYPGRSVDEPEKDKVMRGSRDGFVETVVFNAALVRRRIRSTDLVMEMHTVGSSSRTDVVVSYMQGRVEEKLLKDIKQRIDRIQVDSLSMNQQSLAECLYPKKWYNPFPKFKFTERPDVTAASLLEGNIVIFVDNSPSAMILPTSVFDIVEDADDYYFPPVTGTYLRVPNAHQCAGGVYDTYLSAFDQSPGLAAGLAFFYPDQRCRPCTDLSTDDDAGTDDRWIKTGVREYTEYAEHAVKRGGRYYSGRLYGFIRLV